MSNKEILEKAIQKAIDGGFNPGPSYTSVHLNTGAEEHLGPKEFLLHNMLRDIPFRLMIIFNHDFAKALWGDKQIGVDYSTLNKIPDDIYYEDVDGTGGLEAPAWKFNLQQMVIADDPIKYLGENI